MENHKELCIELATHLAWAIRLVPFISGGDGYPSEDNRSRLNECKRLIETVNQSMTQPRPEACGLHPQKDHTQRFAP